MTDAKYVTVRLSIEGDKFEILVKPDPALEYKTGKRTDFSNILVSDEIYSDANKGLRFTLTQTKVRELPARSYPNISRPKIRLKSQSRFYLEVNSLLPLISVGEWLRKKGSK